MQLLKREVLIGCACVIASVGCSSSDEPARTDAGAADGGSSAAGGKGGQGGKGDQAGAGGRSGAAAPSGGKGGQGGAATGGKGGQGGQATQAGQGGAKPAAGSGGQSSPTGDNSASVLERNKHGSRDGHFVQPALTHAAVAKMARDSDFAANFKGSMWAAPLYLDKGPNDKGVFFAVTTGDDVYALDETTGSTVWTRHIGDPAANNGVGCGSIHPLGIISTPVIDAAARTLFVAGAVGNADTITRHEVHALSVDDGQERPNWPVDVAKTMADGIQFNAPAQNQRSALSLVNGTVYVAYGGHVGDCGNYHGWVYGIDAKDPTKIGAWATLGQGEAIWAAGGLASDGTDVFAVTGNSTTSASSRSASDSEQVVRLSGLAKFDRNDKNLYFPGSWRSMDGADADFGASSPLYLEVPGATPDKFVLAISKDGHLYLLDSSNLGGMGGHVVDFPVSTGAMSIRTTPAAYTTSQGVHVVFSTVRGGMCPSGMPGEKVVMSVRIPAGSPPKPEVAWCVAYQNGEPGPIVTTSDGTNDPIVWFMNASVLTAVNGDTGQALWNAGSDTCTGIQKWNSPIAVKGRIVAAGDNHLCSWSVH